MTSPKKPQWGNFIAAIKEDEPENIKNNNSTDMKVDSTEKSQIEDLDIIVIDSDDDDEFLAKLDVEESITPNDFKSSSNSRKNLFKYSSGEIQDEFKKEITNRYQEKNLKNNGNISISYLKEEKQTVVKNFEPHKIWDTFLIE